MIPPSDGKCRKREHPDVAHLVGHYFLGETNLADRTAIALSISMLLTACDAAIGFWLGGCAAASAANM